MFRSSSSARRVTAAAVLVAGFAAIVPSALPAGAGTAAAVQPSATVPPGFSAYFKAQCQYVTTAPNDPIVFPGQVGVSHSHDFGGNLTINASSTPSQLRRGASNCDDPGDRSAYWMPTLYKNGVAINPDRVDAYYTNGAKLGTIQSFPAGLRMISGDRLATTAQGSNVTSYGCIIGGQAAMQSVSVPTCPAGSALLLRVHFPDCWNGTQSDSADHKSHLARSLGDGSCPAGYPVMVPELVLAYRYPFLGGSGVTLASGNQYSAHADFMNGWDTTVFTEHVNRCVNGGIVCVLPPTPRAAIGNTSALEHLKAISFPVSITYPNAYAPISVDWTTRDGWAKSGTDFVAASGTLTFAPGQSTGTITVVVIDDKIKEADEGFSVVITGNAGVIVVKPTGNGIIVNDD